MSALEQPLTNKGLDQLASYFVSGAINPLHEAVIQVNYLFNLKNSSPRRGLLAANQLTL